MAASFLISNGAIAASSGNLQNKIEKLNSHSLQLLGVSINAVKYLLDASPNHYMPLWYLKQTSEIAYIEELERAGYVTVEIREGLPNGSQPGKFLRLIPAAQGVELQRAVASLQHNQAIKADEK